MEQTRQTYFLDASTFIHAADKNAKYHAACLNILSRAAKGQINTATSFETLEEALFILSKATNTSTALSLIRDVLNMAKIKKYDVNSTIFEHALEIIETTPLKGPKDAINASTMLEHKIQKIISEDTDYDKLSLIQRVHPKDL